MVRNEHMRVFVANGYFDLATPHFATEYTFSHMNLPAPARERVAMSYYQAGHMMYVRTEDRAKLAADIRAFVS